MDIRSNSTCNPLRRLYYRRPKIFIRDHLRKQNNKNELKGKMKCLEFNFDI